MLPLVKCTLSSSSYCMVLCRKVAHFLFIMFHEMCLMAEVLFAAFPIEGSRASFNNATLSAEAG